MNKLVRPAAPTSGAGNSKGNKRSAEQVAMATNVSDDVSNMPKGKRQKMCGRRKKQLPHIINERERRKRMKGMYADLQALLPNVPEKTDKTTIVDEAINSSGCWKAPWPSWRSASRTSRWRGAPPPPVSRPARRRRRRRLTRQRRGRLTSHKVGPGCQSSSRSLPCRSSSGCRPGRGANVVLSVANDYGFINVCVPRRSGVLLLVLSVLEKHRIDVITTHVGTDGVHSMFTIHARVSEYAALQQLGGVPPASEDIYKLAVSEIMVWLSSY
ncbi:hypothetical protein QOZ80_UnG0725620 [Eleusine coracana subsp. coracana]|uniref:BHLH domain-containing protein n=1 Tax=Eleusine coracana subsp. coracana TaxID=191504 RepID=A0AAV9FZG7_ELECO|nr:hypothetical protein QOZ80_UnG0725620 [Eleusine coracana subsp. coracana]